MVIRFMISIEQHFFVCNKHPSIFT